jgi:hypothetical protein
MRLQLQPGFGGAQGVLRAGFSLTRLELSRCTLLDGAWRLAAALKQLPDLQHLSVASVYDEIGDPSVYGKLRRATFPTAVLSCLTKLTSLKLQDVGCQASVYTSSSSSSDTSAALQPLPVLTRLVDLQLDTNGDVTADSLSGAAQLTRLVLSLQNFEPRALAGKTQLQHLVLTVVIGDADMAQLLSELQHLTRLTRLDLSCRWYNDDNEEVGATAPPAAYASLTANSKLQHLNLVHNTLPSAAWQYMCPPGRTLPQLRYLDIRYVREADESLALPNTSVLASCFPSLQTLITSMPCSTA